MRPLPSLVTSTRLPLSATMMLPPVIPMPAARKRSRISVRTVAVSAKPPLGTLDRCRHHRPRPARWPGVRRGRRRSRLPAPVFRVVMALETSGNRRENRPPKPQQRSACSISRVMALETSGNRRENRPPKPQQRSACSISVTSQPARRNSRRGWSRMPSRRHMWQESW